MSLVDDLLALKAQQGTLKTNLEAAQTEVGRRRLLVLNKPKRLEPLTSRETELGMALKLLTDSVKKWMEAQDLLAVVEEPLPPENIKGARKLYKQASDFVNQAQSVLDCKPVPATSDAHPTVPLPIPRTEPNPVVIVIPPRQDDNPLDRAKEVSAPKPSEAEKADTSSQPEFAAILALVNENRDRCNMGFTTLHEAVTVVETRALREGYAEVSQKYTEKDFETVLAIGKWLNDRQLKKPHVWFLRFRRNTGTVNPESSI